MNNVFFSDKGLTITSVNHLANLAKESVRQVEQELKSYSFVNESIKLLVNPSSVTLTKVGITSVDDVSTKLEAIGKMNSFIAWAREAIKEKENQTEIFKNKTFTSWYAENYKEDIDRATYFNPDIDYKSEIINQMTVKELNEMYSLEANVAVIGKFIHPNGVYSNAREDLLTKLNNPVIPYVNGSETIIKEYTPSIELKDVDETFFKLQSEHRTLNARLNQIKYNIDQKALELERIARSKYESELTAYHQRINERRLEFEEYKTLELERIKKLKVVVPESLQEIVDYLKRLGE